MASSRSTNTMAEFLQRMLGELAVAKTLPDADLQFLVGIETMILQKLREPVDAMAGQLGPAGGAGGQGGGPSGPGAGGSPPGAPDMSAMAGGAPPPQMGMAGPPPAGLGAGVGGVGNTPQIPADEFRRMLGG